ncbi:RNA polymerase sigma factor [Streptosporangium sp. NPDC000095]|uniref:RNA polymerase sigma factor n=1 Tax=Streptosporangium sp. NPDC000095 TaxID=3366184 RepID=UPI00368C5018
MTDGALVAALCARSPGALADLYDSYAESIYRYCRSMLATSGAAESALLDTLIAAEAHIHALTDARRLEAWLYALARGECVRRDPDEGNGPQDPAPAVAAGDDADLRVMAWNATRSLSPDDREILDLSCRHGFGPIDLAAVLGVTPKAAGALYESARERLRDVVTTEVLVRKGPYDCASRARMLTGLGGELTPEARERVIRHVNRCDTCAPHRVRQVSAAKVYDLLPLAALPPTLRAWVMSHFTDPERVSYRRDVADRAGPLDGAGFPVGRIRGSRRRPYALAGAAAAVAAVTALALVLVQAGIGSQGTGSDAASDAFPAVVEPSDSWRPGESRREGAPVTSEPVGEGATVERIGSLGVTEPVSATGPDLRSDRRPGVPGPVGHRGESRSRQPGDEPPGEGPPGPVGDGSSGEGPADEGASDDGSPGDGAADRPAAPEESLVPPPSPVPPGAPGIGAPDRHHPSRDHHGHSSRRCRTPHRPATPAPPWTAPGSPREDSAPPRANPRPPGDVTGPRGEHRPPRMAPTPRRTDLRPPRADARPPRAEPGPSRATFTHPRRSRANPDHLTSGRGQASDDFRPASTGPGRTGEGAGPERIATSADRGQTPVGEDSVAGDDYGE